MDHEHEHIMEDTLRRVYAREAAIGREPVFHRTPLDDVLSKESEESNDEYALRMEGADRMLDYFFADGPDPRNVIRRVFAYCKAIRSDLLLNMTHEEIGLLLGETRAAGSARVRMMVNRRLAAAGCKGLTLPGQKSVEACGKYAVSAAGNRNRRNGHD